MSADGIVWEEPPAEIVAEFGKRLGRTQRFVRALADRPGEWALYGSDCAAGTSNNILRNARAEGVKVECRTQRVSGGPRVRVWARAVRP
jgi:hypothetical protein